MKYPKHMDGILTAPWHSNTKYKEARKAVLVSISTSFPLLILERSIHNERLTNDKGN